MVAVWVAAAWAGTSALYGADGEVWDPVGRLPDFSYAGYHAGEAAIPDVAVVTNVRDFGAVGDGVADDTHAFRDAIAATSDGALLVPAGTYRITGVLTIDRSNVVLRGEGPASVLFVDRSLSDVLGAQAQWSWDGGFVWIEGHPLGAGSDVTAGAVRGDTTLQTAGSYAPGDLVLLRLTDDGTGSLGRHLHAEHDDSGTCDYQVPYTLDWPVRIAASDGATVTLAQPLRTDVRPEWSPRLVATDPVVEVGVEHLTMRFPDVPYAGHLLEPGYNGVYLAEGVADAWVRDVTFENADNGVVVAWWTKNVEARDVAFAGRQGHHGVSLAFAADALVDGVTFGDTTFIHELTLDHRANGNVFKHVASNQRVALDHHRDGSFENLFTAFDAETSWISGGNDCAGPNAGARSTYWGLPGPVPPPIWGGIETNLVGELTVADSLTAGAEWYENVEDLVPSDLHESQRRNRLGIPDPDTGDTAADAGTDDPKCGCAAGPAFVPAWFLLVLVRRRR